MGNVDSLALRHSKVKETRPIFGLRLYQIGYCFQASKYRRRYPVKVHPGIEYTPWKGASFIYRPCLEIAEIPTQILSDGFRFSVFRRTRHTHRKRGTSAGSAIPMPKTMRRFLSADSVSIHAAGARKLSGQRCANVKHAAVDRYSAHDKSHYIRSASQTDIAPRDPSLPSTRPGLSPSMVRRSLSRASGHRQPHILPSERTFRNPVGSSAKSSGRVKVTAPDLRYLPKTYLREISSRRHFLQIAENRKSPSDTSRCSGAGFSAGFLPPESAAEACQKIFTIRSDAAADPGERYFFNSSCMYLIRVG